MSFNPVVIFGLSSLFLTIVVHFKSYLNFTLALLYNLRGCRLSLRCDKSGAEETMNRQLLEVKVRRYKQPVILK